MGERTSLAHIAKLSPRCDLATPLTVEGPGDGRIAAAKIATFRELAQDRNGTCNVYVLKEEAMTHRTPKLDATQQVSPALTDEGSRVRERVAVSPEARRKSDPHLSLDPRLESKVLEATALLARLEPQDARARLLHIAVLRRDESLLDGVLAELTAAHQSR